MTKIIYSEYYLQMDKEKLIESHEAELYASGCSTIIFQVCPFFILILPCIHYS